MPLLDPLTERSPLVIAEFDGPSGTIETTMVVDTGAANTYITRSDADAIGLRVQGDHGLRTQDVTNSKEVWRGSILRGMRIGGLLVGRTGVGISSSSNLLGMDLLAQQALELDVGRGVAIIGAPAIENPIVEPVRLLRAGNRLRARVTFDGREVDLLLDTGAGTLMDWRHARRMGLETIRLPEPRTGRGTIGVFKYQVVYRVAALGMGAVEIDDVIVLPLPEREVGGLLNRKEVGLLGADVLRRFRYRIDPRRRTLELADRGDVQAELRERIARWSWVPDCEDGPPACISHEAVECGSRCLSLKLTSSGPYERQAAFLFAQVDASGRPLAQVPAFEILAPSFGAGESLSVELPTWLVSQMEAWGPHSGGLVLLDVNPLLQEPDAEPLTQAMFRYRWLADGATYRLEPPDVCETSTGALDPDALARLMTYLSSDLTRCFARSDGGALPQGALSANWTILPTGTVSRATIAPGSAGDRKVHSCVLVRISAWGFPYPRCGNELKTSWTWSLGPG